MDPIVLYGNPEEGGEFGFIPGEIDGLSLSFSTYFGVYLDETTFLLIAKPILRHAPIVHSGDPVVQRPVWEKIIEDLEALAIRVSQADNLSELDDDLWFHTDVTGHSADKAEFQKDFSANAKALVGVIGELVAWLRETLKTHEAILIDTD